MFGKLIKYELKNCFRRFLPIWGLIIVLCAVVGLGNRGNGLRELGWIGELLSGVLPVLLLGAVCLAACVLAVVYICDRYYKGLLGAEGYLMQTLPVSHAELIFSKLLGALIMLLLSALAGFLGGFLAVTIIGGLPEGSFSSFGAFLSELKRDYPDWFRLTLAIMGTVLLGVVELILRVYAAISLGHLSRKNRVLFAILAYIALSIVTTYVNKLLGASMVGTNALRTLFNGSFAEQEAAIVRLGGNICLLSSLRSILLGAAFFFTSHYVLKNKLNLE